MKNVVIVILCSFSLSACDQGPKEGFGSILGAVGGAVVGTAIAGNDRGGGRTVAIAMGTLAGAAIGNSVGKSLDKADRQAMFQAQQMALEAYPAGQPSTWYNPDTGNSGSYIPKPAVQNESGQYCREYQQTVIIGGKTQEAYGNACRQPDGNWKIINS